MTDLIEASQLTAIRAQFPGTQKFIYFESSAHGLMPLAARDAVLGYVESRIYDAGDKAALNAGISRVRSKFARLIGADADEIAMVKNVSEGVNAIIASLLWQRGDNVVLCADLEHPNSIYALYNVRDRYGVEIRAVPPTPDMATPVESIAKRIDADTKLVVASTVIYTTGTRSDLDSLAELCRDRGVFLLVDGAQSVGALHLDVDATPIDAMTVGASKFLCGPFGFGFLYVRRARAERMQPGYLARYGIDLGDAHVGEKGGAQYKLMPGARRFDLGTHNYIAAAATEVSLDLIENVGIGTIERHVLTLARELTAGLMKLGLPVLSGQVAAHFSHLVLIGRSDTDAKARARLEGLYDHLTRHRVKLSIRHGRLRFALHFYNTKEEVDAVLALTREYVSTTG